MKKLLVMLMACFMAFTLVGCGGSSNNETKDNDKENENLVIDEDDLEAVDDAMDALELLKPEGWSEGNYGGYIYDVYDSDFLPDCFPKQIEGTKASQTAYKDYKHDVINQNYSVGPLWFENKEDYRTYSVSFYAKAEHVEAFLQALEDKGMYGYMEGEGEGFGTSQWLEGFYAGNGWGMYLFFNTNDDQDGEFDGCLTARATDTLTKLPKSISGIPLPQTGIIADDLENYFIYDFSNDYDEVDFDIEKDTLPTENYCADLSYYGISEDVAKDYVKELENNGWNISYEYPEEDYYSVYLEKDGQYALVHYQESVMDLGFSDMMENLGN